MGKVDACEVCVRRRVRRRASVIVQVWTRRVGAPHDAEKEPESEILARDCGNMCNNIGTHMCLK